MSSSRPSLVHGGMSKPFLRKEGSSPKVTEMMGEDGDNSSPDTSIVEEVQKQGSLRRKIGSFAKWKKAYFLLHNSGALMEFGSSEEYEKGGKPGRIIHLDQSEVTEAQNLTGKPYCIGITTKKGMLFLRSDDELEYQSWLLVLQSFGKSNAWGESIEMIRDAVVVADVQGIIVQVNEKAVQMFDYDDKSEMIGKSCEILMPTGVARYHNAYMQRYRDTKESRLIGKPRRVLAKKKGGEEFPIHINLAELIRDGCKCFMTTMQDLSAAESADGAASKVVEKMEKAISEQIRAKTEELEQFIMDNLSTGVTEMAQSLSELRSAKEQLEEENKEMKKQLALANTSNSIISQLVQDNDSPFSTQALIANLTQEIARTRDYETLLRTDSWLTKQMTMVAILLGGEYLQWVLRKHIISIFSRSNASYEIDPMKVSASKKRRQHQEKLMVVVSHIIDSISRSADQVPLPICQIATCLYTNVESKFSGKGLGLVGGFLFLRFFCPALITPEMFGLVSEDPTPKVQRNLVLMSKYIQAVANQQLFSIDHYMFPLNDYFDAHSNEITQYLNAVVRRGRVSS